MQFNENLKNLRLHSALMQKEIAQILNVSVRTFQGWESGRTEPNIEKLIQIAKLFDVSIDDLVEKNITFPEVDAEESQTNLLVHPNE